MGLKDIMDQHHGRGAYAPSPDAEVLNIGDALWTHFASLNQQKDPRRAPGYHPSQMYDFCARREVLDHWFPQPHADFIPPELQMIFDWGTAWHWMVQNHYFGPMGILFGSWRCNTCAKTVKDCFMPDPCATCHGAREWKPPRYGGYWTYIEPHLYDKDWKVPGHGDGIFILNRQLDGPRSLLEIKTINGYGFERLRGPTEPHLFQINIYLWLAKLEECWLTYWTKDAKQQKPKVYRVRYDPSIVEETKKRIDLHRRHWPSKTLCEGICKSDKDKHAVECPQRGSCFRPDIEMVIEELRKNSAAGKTP